MVNFHAVNLTYTRFGQFAKIKKSVTHLSLFTMPSELEQLKFGELSEGAY